MYFELLFDQNEIAKKMSCETKSSRKRILSSSRPREWPTREMNMAVLPDQLLRLRISHLRQRRPSPSSPFLNEILYRFLLSQARPRDCLYYAQEVVNPCEEKSQLIASNRVFKMGFFCEFISSKSKRCWVYIISSD